jgi:hypothetical protein
METSTTRRYVTPTLERFGTFRQLTLIGASQGNDIGSSFGIPGCNANDNTTEFGCARGTR